MEVERKLKAAQHYVAMGWKLFTVQDNKRPWQNCPDCPAGAHDGETCEHVFCHGFQAATDRLDVLGDALAAHPAGLLAVRTGSPSGLVVIDAEGTDRVGYGMTGVEYLDTLPWWLDTLKAKTSSGGLHVYFRPPAGWKGPVPSRNRVAPNIDIKADGGYVVLPPASGRTWLNWSRGVQAPEDDVWEFVKTSKGGGKAGTGGAGSGVRVGSFSPPPGSVVGAGTRYEHLRNLAYKCRKQGVSREDAEDYCRAWWEVYEQPPVAQYALPFRQVVYELDRVYARVSPEPPLAESLINWMAKRREAADGSEE